MSRWRVTYWNAFSCRMEVEICAEGPVEAYLAGDAWLREIAMDRLDWPVSKIVGIPDAVPSTGTEAHDEP